MQKDLLNLELLVRDDNQRLFWWFHISGWMGISLVSYFSLNLWYNQPEISYLAHNLLQSVLGIVISWPLRSVFRAVWHKDNLQRIVVVVAATLLFSFFWSASRLFLFLVMTTNIIFGQILAAGCFPQFLFLVVGRLFIMALSTTAYCSRKRKTSTSWLQRKKKKF